MLKFINPNKIFYLSRIFDQKIHSPWSLEIQPTNVCNLNCNFCAYAKRRKQNPIKLSQSTMDSVINSVKKMKIKGVYLSGGGEPLCWKSESKKISSYIIELSKNTDTALITNGILLANDNFEAAKHCFYVMVSLYDPEYMDNGMTQELYSKVLKNIETFVEWKKEVKAKLPFLIIKVIITKDNYKSIPEIYLKLKRIGVDNIIFRYARNYEGETKTEILPEQKKELSEDINRISTEIETDKTNLLSLAKGINPETSHSKKEGAPSKCWIVDFGFYGAIDANGDVYPCLFYLGNKDYSIGNVNHTPLEDIWGGRLHKRIIEKLHNEIKGSICKRCRFMRYNEEIESLKEDFIEAHASFI